MNLGVQPLVNLGNLLRDITICYPNIIHKVSKVKDYHIMALPT